MDIASLTAAATTTTITTSDMAFCTTIVCKLSNWHKMFTKKTYVNCLTAPSRLNSTLNLTARLSKKSVMTLFGQVMTQHHTKRFNGTINHASI